MEPGFCKIDRPTPSLADSAKIVEILSLRGGQRLPRATTGALRKITDEVGETRDRDHADTADGGVAAIRTLEQRALRLDARKLSGLLRG
jgi:hypothetical protein